MRFILERGVSTKTITGLPRKIDKLGRIVIPSELREILNF